MKIGVFDSGVGGITVLSALRMRFPGADFEYLGDTAHVPYGSKSPAQVERLSLDCARTLREKGVDGLVVACNTASALALPAIREAMGEIPVVGVVEPGVEAAFEALGQFKGRTDPETGEPALLAPILVLATRATVNSGAYSDTLRHMLSVETIVNHLPCPIIEQACPLLVPMIEEGWVDHPVLHQTIAEYVGPHLKTQPPGVALLGCTHYPWIHSAFERALPGWKVVNSAQSVARAITRGPLAPRVAGIAGRKGRTGWTFTDPAAVPAFARELMGRDSG